MSKIKCLDEYHAGAANLENWSRLLEIEAMELADHAASCDHCKKRLAQVETSQIEAFLAWGRRSLNETVDAGKVSHLIRLAPTLYQIGWECCTYLWLRAGYLPANLVSAPSLEAVPDAAP